MYWLFYNRGVMKISVNIILFYFLDNSKYTHNTFQTRSIIYDNIPDIYQICL